MPKLSDMYGMDDNEFAASIAQDALGAPDPNSYSGNPVDQSANAKGSANYGGPSTNPDVVVISDKSDSRATAKGNH